MLMFGCPNPDRVQAAQRAARRIPALDREHANTGPGHDPPDNIDNFTRAFHDDNAEEDPDGTEVQETINSMVARNKSSRPVPKKMQEAWNIYTNEARRWQARQVTLSELRAYVDAKNHDAAIATMRQRSVLILTDDDVVQLDDPNLNVFCDGHYLDYLCVWDDSVGLSAVCGSGMSDLLIDVSLSSKPFSTKHGWFQFNPTERMMCFAKVRTSILVFMVLAPDLYYNVPLSKERWENTKTNTCMSTPHQRVMKVFLSFALSTLGVGIVHDRRREKDVDLEGDDAKLNVLGNFYNGAE
jgi:hypothetical protein